MRRTISKRRSALDREQGCLSNCQPSCGLVQPRGRLESGGRRRTLFSFWEGGASSLNMSGLPNGDRIGKFAHSWRGSWPRGDGRRITGKEMGELVVRRLTSRHIEFAMLTLPSPPTKRSIGQL